MKYIANAFDIILKFFQQALYIKYVVIYILKIICFTILGGHLLTIYSQFLGSIVENVIGVQHSI